MIDKWDLRFLRLAKEISTWSKDPSTKVGAVIVRDKVIVSTGYNGFPKTMSDRPEWYEDREEKYSRIIHAEGNALIHAKQDVSGCVLYTYPFCCCDRCIVMMMEAGIQRFVFPESSAESFLRWGESLTRAKRYMSDSYRVISEIPAGEIDG